MASVTALLVLLLAAVAAPAYATDITVGDATGWGLNFDYSTWASGQTFKVGDTLVFNYAAGAHNVEEVNKADYTSCNVGNSLNTSSDGKTRISLTAAGDRYFICGIGNHCSLGMKLDVSVSAAGSPPATPPQSPPSGSPPSPPSGSPPSPPSGPPPSPPSGPPPSPPTPTSTQTPPPPPSGATRVYGMSAVLSGALLMGLTYFG